MALRGRTGEQLRGLDAHGIAGLQRVCGALAQVGERRGARAVRVDVARRAVRERRAVGAPAGRCGGRSGDGRLRRPRAGAQAARMRVAVVGAGVGGLAAALELARAGHAVTVFEAGPAPGGKCARVTRGPFTWDAGPSLLTMPWVFDDLELDLQRVEPVTRYGFAEGTSVELSADLPRALAALEAWSPGTGAQWARFLGTCASMWSASERFLTGPPPFQPRRGGDPRDALRVKPWWTLRQLARAHTHDPRLRMVIERFATYAGADPRRAPAALAVAGYVEHAFGAWYPRGGLYELVLAMARQLEALGGELRLSAPVSRIWVKHGRARGVVAPDGAHEADVVITDVDHAGVLRLLGRRPRPREHSLSGL